jgi:hypothetical protein
MHMRLHGECLWYVVVSLALQYIKKMNSASFTELWSVSARCVRSVHALSRISKLGFVHFRLPPVPRTSLLAPCPCSPSYASPFPCPSLLPPAPRASRFTSRPTSTTFFRRRSPSYASLFPLVFVSRSSSPLLPPLPPAPRASLLAPRLRPSSDAVLRPMPLRSRSSSSRVPPHPSFLPFLPRLAFHLSAAPHASLLAPRPRSRSYASPFPTPLAALLVALHPSPVSPSSRALPLVSRLSPMPCLSSFARTSHLASRPTSAFSPYASPFPLAFVSRPSSPLTPPSSPSSIKQIPPSYPWDDFHALTLIQWGFSTTVMGAFPTPSDSPLTADGQGPGSAHVHSRIARGPSCALNTNIQHDSDVALWWNLEDVFTSASCSTRNQRLQ